METGMVDFFKSSIGMLGVLLLFWIGMGIFGLFCNYSLTWLALYFGTVTVIDMLKMMLNQRGLLLSLELFVSLAFVLVWWHVMDVSIWLKVLTTAAFLGVVLFTNVFTLMDYYLKRK